MEEILRGHDKDITTGQKEENADDLLHMRGKRGIDLEEVVAAYHDCQKNKRNTLNALRFEFNEQQELIDLTREVNSGTYSPGKSITFIVDKPVTREIFAAGFRDRVIHHLIANKINAIFESEFIDDNYSTRKNKGTLYGIQRVYNMIRVCSDGYTKDCYILKVDIRGFFMAIDKQLLYQEVEECLRRRYTADDIEQLLWLIHCVIFNRPEIDCIFRSPKKKWRNLPKDKTILGTDGTHGLPIGNITSQLLALLFLNRMDHLITEQWQKDLLTPLFYGRYVDDMVLVHRNKEVLMAVREKIDGWLREHKQRLHPKKLYLQHYTKGVLFVGGMILPGRIYTGNRTIGNFINTIFKYNKLAQRNPEKLENRIDAFQASMNSYLGVMQHTASYNIMHRCIRRIDSRWYRMMYISSKKGKMKVVVKERFTRRRRLLLAEREKEKEYGTAENWES